MGRIGSIDWKTYQNSPASLSGKCGMVPVNSLKSNGKDSNLVRLEIDEAMVLVTVNSLWYNDACYHRKARQEPNLTGNCG